MSVKFEKYVSFDALGHLSKQTGGKILYNHERIDKSVRINVVLTNKALPEILNKCLQGTKYMYKGSRWGYMLFPRKKRWLFKKRRRLW